MDSIIQNPIIEHWLHNIGIGIEKEKKPWGINKFMSEDYLKQPCDGSIINVRAMSKYTVI